jgi:hypothetical protein|nr:MAG TPA: hypothetical protein [Bacteriophage sp.]
MKKINYRQYYYNGDYANTELQVPDECGLYEIGLVNISHQVRIQKRKPGQKPMRYYVQLNLKILSFLEMFILTI